MELRSLQKYKESAAVVFTNQGVKAAKVRTHNQLLTVPKQREVEDMMPKIERHKQNIRRLPSVEKEEETKEIHNRVRPALVLLLQIEEVLRL